MKRWYHSTSKSKASVVDEALEAMGAEDLRELVRGLLPWLDDKTHARVTNEIIDRAARGETKWTPSGPTDEGVAEILNFAEAAQRVGHADPSEVDDYLRQGMNAFLAKDYRTAFQIFRALLIPISDGGIDLGQHEMVDEVLGVEVADCAAQYVVAIYMTSVPTQRAKAVKTAIDDMSSAGHFWHPLGELERVAVEPLLDFEDFLHMWSGLVQELAAGERQNEWDTEVDRWRREVVERIEGPDGLAAIARSTRRSDDLGAWCRTLVEARDWKGALAAYDEAAEIVTDKTCSRGSFLDGAALAAQELGRKDLPSRLQRAWHLEPSLLRLRRWLGSSSNKSVIKKRTAAAIEVCPKKAYRQLAFLRVLHGDFAPAAKLLASAPGLGWSNSEHPGHLLFPIFCRLLGAGSPEIEFDTGPHGIRDMDIDLLEPLGRDRDEPRLPNPAVEEIVSLACIPTVDGAKERSAVLKAMRAAAEKRIEGVTENKRRRYYGHAASLAAACVDVDASKASVEWMAAICSEYRRFPALQRELKRYGG